MSSDHRTSGNHSASGDSDSGGVGGILGPTRRGFVGGTIGAGLALSAPGIVGASSERRGKLRTVLIGSGWWGTNIMREAVRSGRCKMVGLCDVDERQLDSSAQALREMSSDEPNRYKDFREALEQEKPDIAIVATPDHWHPLITIAACEAGAHVYVEKPIGHTIMEGRAMVNAARRNDRVVQVGTHRRVSPHHVSARQFIQEGRAGEIGMIRAFVYYGGGAERPVENTEPPDEIDWDMWCGPAPKRHYCENFPSVWGNAIHPRGFRNYFDYANGTIADWGVHWLDQILWVMDVKWPRSVHSTGGRPIRGEPVYNEQEQTSDAPDHQVATYEFDDFTAVWENRNFSANRVEKTHPSQAVGCYFYGTKGILHAGWLDGWTFYPTDRNEKPIHEEAQLHEPDNQNIRELWVDFLNAIDNGSRPICDIEAIHYSTNLSLLGVLSYKLGRSIRWDGESERCIGDDEANSMLRRDYRGPWEYPEA